MMKNDQDGSWKMEELAEWNENIFIQVPRLMLEVSKIIWKLKWINSELKSAKDQFQDDITRVMELQLELTTSLQCFGDLG